MASQPKIVPAKQPIKVCPFTGRELSVVKLGSGKWQLRGHGWVCVQLFNEESEAWHWASHRMGVAPAFEPRVSVEVRDDAEPEPDPLDDIRPAGLPK